ncbi:MAG TPA: DegQ family serine endoprotease [Methylococcaceae bacterium]|nr:DegQ family serine endoprotease [Methylococcaceae bacterium]HIA45852.1 DegQ family serine endoprotease [Methylococcaceae bacterium]HIN68816.1 DegQ family serine endoprotease [Methylococcales bacterium]HIO44115.1 DegQ family serine endoprotease [Methylococcales bacterium]
MVRKLVGCLGVLLWLTGSVAFAQLPDFTQLVKEQSRAVVNISSVHRASGINHHAPDGALEPGQIPMEEFLKRFFEGQGQLPGPRSGPHGGSKGSNSLGSGFIISEEGYILTNHHVIQGADEIIVKLSDRRELIATLVGSDPRTDVALLKVKAHSLPIVEIGSVDELQVGEWVLAIGTPFGFEHSVTAGVVSAKGRSLPGDNYVPFIQTDVAINPGNSGGPLFNLKGQVVGMNSQIVSRSGGYMGLSFAIPMDVVMTIVEQLKNSGQVSRGWLGVHIQDVTSDLAESFGMDRPYGAVVAKVIPEGPAASSDLQTGDVIIAFEGKKIELSSELPPLVGVTPVNKVAKIKVVRAGKIKIITVKIGLLPEQPQTAAASIQPSPQISNRLGVVALDLTPEQRTQLQLSSQGVVVHSVLRDPARAAGIQPGDVILRIQNNVVRNLAAFDKIVRGLPVGKSISILIERQGRRLFLPIKIEK